MALKVYRDTPFNIGTEVDPVTLLTGVFGQTEYTVVDGSRLGATVQFDAIQYYQFNGGFTRNGDVINLSGAPPDGSRGVAPGMSTILFDALFDQDDIPGVAEPRVREVPFYLVDIDTIHLYSYEGLPAEPGIEICFVDIIDNTGAELSWVQLACAEGDADGLALTYQATGECLYTAPLKSFGTLLASAESGASSILVDLASTFHHGDYILINSGQANQEIVKIIGGSGQTLEISGTDFDHNEDEVVYACGRKFWAKVTVPLNAVGNEAINLYDLVLRNRITRRSRV